MEFDSLFIAEAISWYTCATVSPCSIALFLSTVLLVSIEPSSNPFWISLVPSTLSRIPAISLAMDFNVSKLSPFIFTSTPEPPKADISIVEEFIFKSQFKSLVFSAISFETSLLVAFLSSFKRT